MGRYARKISIVFLLLQAVLYVTFLVIDLYGTNFTLSMDIKFSIIILCFCYALFLAKGADKGILFYMRAGLLFTLISDLFILVLDVYIYGVLTFIIVQQLYGIRLTISELNKAVHVSDNTKAGIRNIMLFRSFITRLILQSVITVVICLVLKSLGVVPERLLVASVFYFISIITNTIRSQSISHKQPKDKNLKMFAIGMTLFLLCDINVGLFNLSGFLTLPDDIYQIIYCFSSILMWTFYAPSQVLISLSTDEQFCNNIQKS